MSGARLHDLERLYRGHHNTCGASAGSCFHPACRCPCHRWAREVVAYVEADRRREREARQAPAPVVVVHVGPMTGPPRAERDLQDMARQLAHERGQLPR